MGSDDKKRLNLVYVEPSTHSQLVELANKEGESVGDFAGIVLDEVIGDWEYPTDDEPERLIRWNLIRAERRKAAIDRVYRLAAIYQEYPDDDLADLLEQQCELAGLALEEVMHEVEGDPFSSIMAYSRDGSKFGRVVRWLGQKMQEGDGRVPVRLLEMAAEKQGFNRNILVRAKRAINNNQDTPSIKSVKRGMGWVWVLVDEEEDQEDDM